MNKELIERLLKFSAEDQKLEGGKVLMEAADTIEAQDARIAELEQALRWIEKQEPATQEITLLNAVCQVARNAITAAEAK